MRHIYLGIHDGVEAHYITLLPQDATHCRVLNNGWDHHRNTADLLNELSPYIMLIGIGVTQIQ